MVFTRGLVRSINAAIRRVCGGRREWSIGIFGSGNYEFSDDGNRLASWMWETESNRETDLLDEIENPVDLDIPDVDGVVILDCYCRFPDDDENGGCLDQNVYVCITAGKVVHAGNRCEFMIGDHGNWAVDAGSTARYLRN